MPGPARSRFSARSLAFDAWPLGLAVLLCLPLLVRPGHPLARDLVFVPHQPWTDAAVGLGDSAPRAVPLDALVALATTVVDGGVLARVLLPLILATAGWGAQRLLRDLGATARLVAGGLAVWNPYVVERLALGQWALLAGYAAVPWLLVAARRFAASGRAVDLAPVVAWLGLASITPTGGLLGSLMVLVAGAGRGARTLVLAAGCLLLQLPWLLPSVLGPAAVTSDPDGVGAFAAEAEGPGGVLLALLGTGGIWDSGSVPTTRDSWWAPVAALVAVLAIVLGWRVLSEVLAVRRLALAAGIGLALAGVSSLPGGEPLVRWLVETVPGAGLLRDGQKFLAPYVLLVVIGAGASAHRLVRRAVRHGRELALSTAVLAIAAPLMLVPDGAVTTWRTLDPVSYADGLDAVAAELEDRLGDLVTLPWRAYRRFDWGNGTVSSDPAVRWFDRVVVVSDDLQVGRDLVEGENARARRVAEALASRPLLDALAEEGIAWALVYRDDPEADALDLTGLEPVYADDDLALYRVPGAAPSPSAGTGTATRVLVLTVDAAVLLLVLGGLVVAVGRSRKRTRTASAC